MYLIIDPDTSSDGSIEISTCKILPVGALEAAKCGAIVILNLTNSCIFSNEHNDFITINQKIGKTSPKAFQHFVQKD